MQKYIKEIFLIALFVMFCVTLYARMGAKQQWHKFVWAAVILFFLPVPSAYVRFHLMPNPAYVRIFDAFYVACFVSAFLLLIKGNKLLKKSQMGANPKSEKNEA
jgi:hypothetical protein